MLYKIYMLYLKIFNNKEYVLRSLFPDYPAMYINQFEVTLNTLVLDAFGREKSIEIFERLHVSSDTERNICLFWLYKAKRTWILDIF